MVAIVISLILLPFILLQPKHLNAALRRTVIFFNVT